jgi:hypothetical protein
MMTMMMVRRWRRREEEIFDITQSLDAQQT